MWPGEVRRCAVDSSSWLIVEELHSRIAVRVTAAGAAVVLQRESDLDVPGRTLVADLREPRSIEATHAGVGAPVVGRRRRSEVVVPAGVDGRRG